MPTTVTVNSGYSGELAGEIFVQAFKKSDTIAKNAITVIPNVLGSGFLPKLSFTSAQAAASCGFSPSGSVNYTDKEVVLKRLEIKNELCKEDFAATFQARALNLFGAESELPSTIQEALLEAMVGNMGTIIDAQIWVGNNDADSFNGLLTQWAADAQVVDVTILAVTKANVIAQLDAAYDAVIDAVEDDEDLVMAVSKNVAKSYKRAIADQGLNTYVGEKELDYLGVRMESIGGLPANTIAIYRVKNVGFLTGLESDLNEVLIEDRAMESDFRTKMKYSANVGYSFGQEIVYARPA